MTAGSQAEPMGVRRKPQAHFPGFNTPYPTPEHPEVSDIALKCIGHRGTYEYLALTPQPAVGLCEIL